ncbi:MAG: zinc ribbon domain-containing protein [Oscillospiraceae bacterium]|nr:zinc ribbon domain-containing protein [Oscillospiraceae bacterium]
MKIICKNCGMTSDSGANFCTYCGAPNDRGNIAIKPPIKKKTLSVLLLILGVSTAMIFITWILNLNLLLPWQRGARRNKQVILEYAEEHYPDAKIIGKEFNSAKFFVWNNFMDCIVFEWDNIEFGITAEGGKILVDGYCGARAIAQFDKIIQTGFFEPREIEARTDYSFMDNYYELYPYTGRLVVRIWIADQGSTPREVGCLYDFYQYWHNEGAFLKSYDVWIRIRENDKVIYYVDFKDRDPLLNENEFYSSFERGDY